MLSYHTPKQTFACQHCQHFESALCLVLSCLFACICCLFVPVYHVACRLLPDFFFFSTLFLTVPFAFLACLIACACVCVVSMCVWSVQWKVPGLAGRPGHSVRCLAAADTTSGHVRVAILHPPTEGTSASGCIQKRRSATHTLARVSSPLWPPIKDNWFIYQSNENIGSAIHAVQLSYV